MFNFILVTIINFFSLLLVSNIINGIYIYDTTTLIASAIVLTAINLFLKPILKIVLLPINILTLGFFTLIVNALILYLVSDIVKGFYVKNFYCAFWGALLLSVIYLILETFIIERNETIFMHYKKCKNIYKNEKVNNKQNIVHQNVIDVEEIKDDDKEK